MTLLQKEESLVLRFILLINVGVVAIVVWEILHNSSVWSSILCICASQQTQYYLLTSYKACWTHRCMAHSAAGEPSIQVTDVWGHDSDTTASCGDWLEWAGSYLTTNVPWAFHLISSLLHCRYSHLVFTMLVRSWLHFCFCCRFLLLTPILLASVVAKSSIIPPLLRDVLWSTISSGNNRMFFTTILWLSARLQ